ncbi:MAG TPA: hypothetical protein VI306_03670 [Pyrinomonadaceae bacterium]
MKSEKKYERAKKKMIQAALALTSLYDQKARTQIIRHGIHLERLIAKIIECHCGPKEEKHAPTFCKRISSLDKLLKQFYPDIHAATPGLIGGLNYIRKVRNDFAHGELVLEEAKLLGNSGKPPDGIYLRTNENGKVVEKFWRDNEINEQLKLAGDLALLVRFVYAEVENRVNGRTANFAPFLQIVKSQSPHLLEPNLATV